MTNLIRLVFLFFFSLPAVGELLWIEERTGENGTKINETTFSVLSKNLDMPIRVDHASTRRALKLITSDTSRLACRGNLKKTPERLKNLIMTERPQLIFPGLVLYSHKNLLLDGELDLNTYSQESLVLGIERGRYYDGEIKRLENPLIQTIDIHTSQSSKTVVEMFNRKRVDAIVEYPAVYERYSNEEAKRSSFVYRLKNVNEYSLGFIACSPTAAGRALVEQLDKIIHSVSKQANYFEAQVRWFPSESSLTIYNKVYATEFDRLPSTN